MISAVQTQMYDPVQTVPLRRMLFSELTEVKEVFDHHHWTDTMSLDLKDWHRQFTEGVKSSAQEEKMLTLFIGQLQEILRDKVLSFRSPLEENSYLGSDGNVYGYKALCYYLHQISQKAADAPLLAREGRLFFVKETPHPLVKAAVLWLQKRGEALPLHPEIERVFEELQTQHKLPELPTEEVARYQERVRKLAAEESAYRQKLAQEEEEAERASSARIDALFARVLRKEEEISKAQQERLQAEKKRDEEAKKLLEQEQAFWKGRVGDLTNRLQELQGRLEKAEEGTSQEEKDTLRLEESVQKTSVVIAERNAKREEGGLTSVFITIAAVIVTIVLQEAGVFVAPVSGGGVQAGIFKPF